MPSLICKEMFFKKCPENSIAKEEGEEEADTAAEKKMAVSNFIRGL